MLDPRKPPASLMQSWQGKVWGFFFLLCICLGLLGVYTLHISPTLFFDAGDEGFPSKPPIQKIAGITLESTFFQNLPEFFVRSAETRWWQMQKEVYTALRAKDVVAVEFTEKDGVPQRSQAQVGFVPLFEVVKKTWLIYLVALFYLVSARSVFRDHRSVSGVILGFFFLACALYFTSAAPVVYRSLSLQPVLFQLFVSVLHCAAGGLITLAHFGLVFPEPKRFIQQYPWLPYLLYGYFVLTTVLYLSGITAFGATFPVFCFWVLVIVGAFLHSFLSASDPFAKKQISLSLTAPVFASLFFVLLYLLPGVLGTTSIPFTYFALFSLILPFALPLAMDNLALYHDRLESEQQAQQERERIRADLHDIILNNLAVISRSSEISLARIDRNPSDVRKRLRATQDLATDTSRQLREFLWVLDDSHNTWEELCGSLRSWGHELAESFGFEFAFEIAPAVLALPPASLQLRVCLDRVYKEALTNVAKHTQADHVQGSLVCQGETVICEIQDNGTGFDLHANTDGHYGLKNMRKRVEDLGGTFDLTTRAGEGTGIRFQLPLE